MQEDHPRPGAVHDLVLVVAVTLFVIGSGTVAMILTGAGIATVSTRPGCIVAATPTACLEPEVGSEFGPLSRSDALTPAGPDTEDQMVESEDQFATDRVVLLEMSARLRRTTLGSDPTTRDTVSAEISANQSLGIAGSPWATEP